ncbi:MAG: hypothetical protein FJY20_07440 [Bacteroidetes bacterium]|nr:hypothetical protein [Bacteroidota bacterium]
MKKWLIGSFVGAIIVFAWQFLSWSLLGVHSGGMKYHAAQDSIITFLSSTISEDGAYMLPTAPPGSSEKQRQERMKQQEGKPWASVIYHSQFKTNMAMQMTRGFLVDLFLVFSLIYILTRGGTPPAMRIFAGSVVVGLFTFLWGPYTGHNWFDLPMAMIKGDLIDALAGG